jgi:hypothetical protein
LQQPWHYHPDQSRHVGGTDLAGQLAAVTDATRTAFLAGWLFGMLLELAGVL